MRDLILTDADIGKSIAAMVSDKAARHILSAIFTAAEYELTDGMQEIRLMDRGKLEQKMAEVRVWRDFAKNVDLTSEAFQSCEILLQELEQLRQDLKEQEAEAP